jgi:hypothetical protein
MNEEGGDHQNCTTPLMIKIWTRGQNLAQKSKFSELPQNERVRSPHRHEPSATRLGSNGRWMREDIAICSNRQTGKKNEC